MFASYTGKRSRSLSTTDVYCLGEDNNEEVPRSSFTRLVRQQIHRPTTRPPPVPPKRSDSFNFSGSTSSTDAGQLTRVRSYLSADIRDKFESTARQTSERLPSPNSSSFVKKLVATLERRQKEGCANPTPKGPDIYKHSSFRELSRCDRNAITLRSHDDAPIDLTTRRDQLEEVHEDEESDCSSESTDEYLANPKLIYPTLDLLEKPKKQGSLMKNVLSSLMNWKIGNKSLPKGSRDYYAARESLGEEMRQFRCDTMPRLMEHAAINNRLPELCRRNKNSERPRRDTQDFAKLIPRANNVTQQQQQQPNPRSIATIHPIYNNSYYNKVPISLQLHHRETAQVAIAAKPRPTTRSDEHHRDLQKRLSQEIDSLAGVKLRPRAAQLYDVPKSNQPVIVQKNTPQTDQCPHYQNIGHAISQDKRLSSNLFTTF